MCSVIFTSNTGQCWLRHKPSLCWCQFVYIYLNSYCNRQLRVSIIQTLLFVLNELYINKLLPKTPSEYMYTVIPVLPVQCGVVYQYNIRRRFLTPWSLPRVLEYIMEHTLYFFAFDERVLYIYIVFSLRPKKLNIFSRVYRFRLS